MKKFFTLSLTILLFSTNYLLAQTQKFPMDEFIGTNIWWDNYGKYLDNPAEGNIQQLNTPIAEFIEI